MGEQAKDSGTSRAVVPWQGESIAGAVGPGARLEKEDATEFAAGERLAPDMPADRTPSRRLPRGLYWVGLIAAAGLGWLCGSQALPQLPSLSASLAAHTSPSTDAAATARKQAADVGQSRQGDAQEEAHLAAIVDSLKDEFASLKEDIADAERDQVAKLAEIADRLKRLERPDVSAKLAQIEQKLDKVERPDVSAKLAQIEQKIEKVDRDRAPAPTAATGQQAALSEPRAERPLALPSEERTQARPPLTDGKPAIEGWVVRDVRRGVALIEGRDGYLEVVPGMTVPGVGRVESIERRGRDWAVVTSRGTIPYQSW